MSIWDKEGDDVPETPWLSCGIALWDGKSKQIPHRPLKRFDSSSRCQRSVSAVNLLSNGWGTHYDPQ